MDDIHSPSEEQFLDGTDTSEELQSPQAEAGSDNKYTALDEHGYDGLDEENDREVSSRGGMANYTQDVDADPQGDNPDDAEVRDQELPIQNLDNDAV